MRLFALLLMLLPTLASATLSPYFKDSQGQRLEDLPLEFSQAQVQISHAIAEVTLTQRFGNRGDAPIEAIYVFPGSATAAVRGLTLKLGERRVEAQIRERAQAEQTYQKAKEAGQTASLLRQTGVGTYEINVANILPGDAIEVELRYVEALTPVNGSYRFVLPNTFGVERYGAGEAGTARQQSSDAAVVQDAWFVSARVQAAMPIATLHSPSHAITVSQHSAADWQLLLDVNERRAATRDFVLEYTLGGGEVQTGLMLYEQEGQGWFLWTMEPPLEVMPEQIPPREFIFLLDVSGSMNGAPLDTAKQLMRSLAQVLRPTDHLNAITFAGGSELLSERSLPATQATVDRLLKFVDSARSGGGTELLPALERAYGLPDEGAMRSVVVVTDGGISFAHDAAQRISDELARTGTFVFGVGAHLSQATLARMAEAAQTRPLIVEDNRLDEAALAEFRGYVDRPLLRNVQLEFEGMSVQQPHPAAVPMLYAARPLTVSGRYQPPARGLLRVSGESARGPFQRSIEVGAFRPDPAAGAIRHLWAQRAIDAAMRQSDHEARREQVTALGLEYGLMSQWTYFVAVDQQVRNPAGESSRVQQPSARRATLDVASGDLSALPGMQLFGGMFRHRGSRQVDDGQCRQVADTSFVRQGGIWRAQLGTPGARPGEVRLRPGGAAWNSLLAQWPPLQDWAALGEVELTLDGWRLRISADGFDHYPAATLARLGQALAQAGGKATASGCADVLD